jgi:hypothetical protein
MAADRDTIDAGGCPGTLNPLDPIHVGLTTLLALAAVPLVSSVAYLLGLASASFFYRPGSAPGRPRSRLLVLIPAHNEAQLIGRCLESLLRQTYPARLFRICVIADNCTDETAAVAARSGAEIMVRDQATASGKGQALRWALDRILSRVPTLDAIVVVDADSVADVQLLRQLEHQLVLGHEVVQGACVVRAESGSPREDLQAAAVALRLDVRFSGRAVLGMPAILAGNGMLLSRRVLTQHPWNAFTAVEDAEYGLNLRLAGVKTAYARAAIVNTPAASTDRGAYTQSLRWEGGRFALMRAGLGSTLRAMLRTGDWTLLDMVVDLAIPPLGALTVAAVVGTSLATVLVLGGVVSPWVVLPWACSTVVIPVYVLAGLASARAPRSAYVALALAPLFLVRKARIYAGLARGFNVNQWVRTERSDESRPGRLRPKA